jgi:5-methylcytosine-specific restriction enzyme B
MHFNWCNCYFISKKFDNINKGKFGIKVGKMLDKLLIELAKQVDCIYTLSSNEPIWITKVDSNGLYVETEKSREKLKNGEQDKPWEYIPFDFIRTGWKEFIEVRTANSKDFIITKERSSFLLAFFHELPFITKTFKENTVAIQLKEFTTEDLPSEQFHKVIAFLEEVINGIFDPKRLSEQTDSNLYRIKSRGRQDLRLLGFLNDENEKNESLFHEYINAKNKYEVIKKQIVKHPYNKIVLEVLKLLSGVDKNEKKAILVELGKLIVRNSRGENLMVESVAKERTTNLLNWLNAVGIVDNEWNLIQQNPENELLNFNDFKHNIFHSFFIKLRKYRANQLKELLNGKNKISLQQFNEEVWNIGYAVLNDTKLNVFNIIHNKDFDTLKKLNEQLEKNQLIYRGNSIWGTATRVYGAQLKLTDQEKEQFINNAIEILNRTDLTPLEKVNKLLEIKGFGENIATGLVMVFHPDEFAIFNSQSVGALRKLGYSPDTLEDFQKDITRLKETLHAADFIELDWYLYWINQDEERKSLKFWWVNQSKTFKEEREGGYLWAPKRGKDGKMRVYHRNLLHAKLGDIVFAYSKGEIKAVGIVKKEAEVHSKPKEISSENWDEEGYLVRLTYYDLISPIKIEEISEEWRLNESGPFDRYGDVKLGYFFEVSEEFVGKLLGKFKNHFPQEVMDIINTPVQEEEKTLTYEQVINHIHSYISSKGFYYEKEELINLFLSLKTKPFVILSGISGTGKTKIVQWLAESVGATEKNGRFTLIPVRPDWNDGSDLLGYVDIKGDFKPGPLTQVILEAEKNPNYPYFVVLDEMNLARVEYYFSDVLSVMESRRWESGKIVSSNLLSRNELQRKISLPSNVYIIGTVNMDETTYPFSKKVLDRANTIEFNRVNLSHLEFLKEREEVQPIPLKEEVFSAKYLHLKDVYQEYPHIVEQATNELVKVNQFLQPLGAHVGYRVRDEICFYLAYNEEGNLMTYENAFDYCLLQKILPRISGSDSRVQRALEQLYTFCASFELNGNYDDLVDFSYARYPKSAVKILEMLRRLTDDGFTSFWISS